MVHVILPGHRIRQILHFTAPQMSVAEQNRAGLPKSALTDVGPKPCPTQEAIKANQSVGAMESRGDKPP